MKLLQLMIGILVTLTAGVTGVFNPLAGAGSTHEAWVDQGVQAVRDWEQVNSNGFGDTQVMEMTALEAFNGFLYAGTHNLIDPAPLFDGAQIFRSSDGTTWVPVTQPGFGNSHDIAPPAILDFIVFNNQLYASTGRGNASQIWRSSNGTIWAPMDVTGFSDPDNVDITALAVYDGKIYAGVTNHVTGAQVWSSFTGDNNSWTQIAPAMPGTVPSAITGFAAFTLDGGLYAAVESEAPAQIWRSYGGDWEIVVNDGFGDGNTLSTGGLTEFGGYLYVGAGNTTVGAQLWRTHDGTTWEQTIDPGFGDRNNQTVETVFVFQNQLYVSVNNAVAGMEIWRSTDGTLWEQANLNGFGDSNNSGTNEGNATAVFLGQLYVGTSNILGGELWRTVQPNNPPTDIALSHSAVNENQPVNTVVGLLTATDPDAGAIYTFGLACATSGTDDAAFNILGTSLRTSTVFDFEMRSTYNICIRVTDQDGLTFDKNFIITVNDVIENAAPIDIALSNTRADENQTVNTVIGTLTATDPDAGATFTFSLACAVTGVDDAAFNISGTNLRTSAVFDFETKSTYSMCIHVADQGGLTFEENFVITVNNLNEAPTNVLLSHTMVDENQPFNTMVGTLTAIDPDTGATFTFSLICAAPSADNMSFNISGTNLRTSTTFDFETKSTYNICIRVTDQGGLFFEENFIITVNNLGENTAPTDISLSNSVVDENQPINTVVGMLSATDADAGETFNYSLTCASPGVDDAYFNIQGTNLQTSAQLDFEAQSSYSICIRVTDRGGLTFDKNIVVTVNDQAETSAPTDISLSAHTVTENQPINTVVGTLTATDPDAGETFTFSLACAGADNGFFNILGTDLRTSATFDFETKPTYDICIRVTDPGGLSFKENFVVTVKDVHEPTSTPGKVTGGGNIGSDQGKDKITFSLNISYQKDDTQPQGNLTYQDHKADVRLKAKAFQHMIINGNHIGITGTGILNDGQLVWFTLEMDASGKLGQAGTFYIHIPALNGYEAGGALTGGYITIH